MVPFENLKGASLLNVKPLQSVSPLISGSTISIMAKQVPGSVFTSIILLFSWTSIVGFIFTA